MRPSLGIALCLMLSGCGSNVDEGLADRLWTRIQSEGYRDWARAPGYDSPKPTVSAHGDTALVFVNDVVTEALAGPALEAWPVGTLLVKDIFEDGELTLVAAMHKVSTGWHFAEWSPDGEPEYAGLDLDVCTSCHGSGNDRVRAVPLPE